MASEFRNNGLKVVGTRPIRPDGVEKVTGRANFGAARAMPGMLYGKIKRSPHAHARITKINTEEALALPGVRAVVTAADFSEIPPEEAFVGEGPMNFRDLSRNVMARGKALYEGHAVAAVAAVSPSIAAQALELIDVEYEVLPHVIDAPRYSMTISSPRASIPRPKSRRTLLSASASRRAMPQRAFARLM
jgi:CO/xanthine dehydrogenase Mo-binding subunit